MQFLYNDKVFWCGSIIDVLSWMYAAGDLQYSPRQILITLESEGVISIVHY